MQGIVEGFEGEFVVVEIDGVTKDIAISDVDDSVKAGDVVKLAGNRWVKDVAATESRTRQIGKLINDVWGD